MAAGPRYVDLVRIPQKTPLPTLTQLFRVTQPLPNSGCFSGSTILAFSRHATIYMVFAVLTTIKTVSPLPTPIQRPPLQRPLRGLLGEVSLYYF
jgi:hypothetical protein